MREILFRGKRTDNKEWVYGSPIFQDNYVLIRFWNSEEFEYEEYLVAPETVGQFTGIIDNNGNKIFEGDIVEGADFTIEDGGYGLVSFEDGAFEVNGNNIIGTFHENYWGKEFEVIGNIHDNPELY